MFFTVADHPIPVNIKRQKRRSLTIQVKDGQIFVMAPLLMREETIVGFLLKKKRWIHNRITQISLPEFDVEEGYYFLFGIKHPIPANQKKLTLDPTYLTQRLTFWQNHLNLFPKKVSVKMMKRSWGRCSSNGTVTLNIRLLHYDKRFIDAVIVHELVHLNHLNHSKSYKDALDEALPEYRVWIKLNRLT
jgi:predicted metal-dependent hydrolase